MAKYEKSFVNRTGILLIILAIVLLIVLTFMITGLCLFTSSCNSTVPKGIAFGASSDPGSGTVQLNWTQDFAGILESPIDPESISFNLRIWWDGSDISGTADEILLLTNVSPIAGITYTQPVQTTGQPTEYNYSATLVAKSFFSVGTNSITLQSIMGTGDATIQSDQTSPATTVNIEASISTAALFSGDKFAACGYADVSNPYVNVLPTPLVLLWEQPVDNDNLVPSDFCYTVVFTKIGGKDLSDFGFPTKPYSVNGITVKIDTTNLTPNGKTNTLIITPTANATITKIPTACCCIPEDQETGIIQFDGDKSNFYLFLRSPTPVNELLTDSVTANLSLYTYQSNCATVVAGGRSQADLYVAGPTSAPTLTQTSCNLPPDTTACKFVEGLSSNQIETSIIGCYKTHSPKEIGSFTGGSAVQFTLTSITLGQFKLILYVTESIINSPSEQYSVILSDSTTWPITWNLPSGYYTTSSLIYKSVYINGPLIPIYALSQNITNGVFQVNLDTPQSLDATASLS